MTAREAKLPEKYENFRNQADHSITESLIRRLGAIASDCGVDAVLLCVDALRGRDLPVPNGYKKRVYYVTKKAYIDSGVERSEGQYIKVPNVPLTRTMIAENVWDISFASYSNVIDVYVNFLRKKIDRDRGDKLIVTVRGIGYMMRDPDRLQAKGGS